MLRQIAVVVFGTIVSLFLVAGSAYSLYHLPSSWDSLVPMLARYVAGPLIALLTGAFVGAIARMHPEVVGGASAMVYSFLALWKGRNLPLRLVMFLFVLAVVQVLIAGMSARISFAAFHRGNRLVPSDTQ